MTEGVLMTAWLKRLHVTLILSMLLALAFFPAAAQADAAGQAVSMKLKLGNDYITINDKQITIETPYISNGSTLVPLRVITTAFGAVLSWDSETQTVGLKYGSINITLKIGSTTATVNGKSETLETAPELKNGTTMVPLRFISEKFGAKVSFDEATSSITITGSAASPTDSSTAGIDSDLGKTHIGNSYYGWSMKYPSGLVKSYQSFQEDYVSFADANGEFRLSVIVLADQSENLSQDALISLIADQIENETMLEKTYISNGDRSYARVLTKAGGKIFEYRAYQKGDKVYLIIFTINKEDNYNTPAKYNGYKDLMDSFTMTFDSSDKTLKDLSTVKDGLRTYTNDTYGISLKLPANWSKAPDDSNSFTFYDPKQRQFIGITVTSKKDGDTLQAWSDRSRTNFMNVYVPDYRKIEPERSLTIDGNPAVAHRNANTFDLKKWDATDNIYLIKGNYKYYIYFEFTRQEDLSESFIKSTLDSLKISQPSSSIGIIKDPSDDLDKTKTTVYKNKNYHFSVTVPSFWKQEVSKSSGNGVMYSFRQGTFSVYADDDTGYTPQRTIEKLESGVKDRLKDSDITLTEIENRTETIAGVQAVWAVWETNENVTTACSFEKNGTTYLIIATNSKATNNDAYKKMLVDAIKSFQFTD
jgi:hypothetical protein